LYIFKSGEQSVHFMSALRRLLPYLLFALAYGFVLLALVFGRDGSRTQGAAALHLSGWSGIRTAAIAGAVPVIQGFGAAPHPHTLSASEFQRVQLGELQSTRSPAVPTFA
jgi:hypothetical protein